MRVLLEFGPNFGIFAYCFSSFLRVLLECGSYSRAGLFRGFTVSKVDTFLDQEIFQQVAIFIKFQFIHHKSMKEFRP